MDGTNQLRFCFELLRLMPESYRNLVAITKGPRLFCNNRGDFRAQCREALLDVSGGHRRRFRMRFHSPRHVLQLPAYLVPGDGRPTLPASFSAVLVIALHSNSFSAAHTFL